MTILTIENKRRRWSSKKRSPGNLFQEQLRYNNWKIKQPSNSSEIQLSRKKLLNLCLIPEMIGGISDPIQTVHANEFLHKIIRESWIGLNSPDLKSNGKSIRQLLRAM
ncbi:7223_t:CDS:2 [Funneliformis caledonium]|uniref:7223_t:CDS:1 n=1 Tax=Funneliformis caledonium TaxID=1117310 RepID=A0A9N9BJT5_9GLOM|nr:7223_t:CDS:2 [Funneliformis caledonium]